MILIFVASLNENMKLAKILQEQLLTMNQGSEIINLVELNLPIYDSGKEEKEGIPSSILPLIDKMEKASGYIIVSPEYNYSIPPVLVNTIAWISRVGDDFRKVFTLKKIQLATHSGAGGLDVMTAIRLQLTKLGAIILPREIVSTYQKTLNKESSERILSQFVQILKE